MVTTNPAILPLLHSELVGWLTTVNADDQPQASAIWFVVDGDDLVMYSRPTATRLANIAMHPKVAFNLRGDPQGDETLSLEGHAAVDPSMPPPIENPAYMQKYGSEILRLGWTLEEYNGLYTVAVRLTVTRVRHFEHG
ncbi:MAG: pyridoxamine 5'-phosphate oxidase family protein [Thermomicrobiales bacterium]